LLLGGEIFRGNCLQVLLFHHLVSASNERAKGGDVDRLAAIDAGLYGAKKQARLGDFRCARINLGQLGRNKCGEIDMAIRQNLPDLLERKTCPLERNDRTQAG